MQKAFSLVELSIVLVILGLLTGGILTGQSLIRAAELRSVSTEFSTYQVALQTFRSKYLALPGDMNNATSFWGSAGGSGTIGDGCETASGTGTQTCNGDGNGVVLPFGGAGAGEYGEYHTFWQHLANAGLIEGSYTGQNGPGGVSFDSVIGENIPSSKLSSAGWSIGNPIVALSSNLNLFEGNYGHRFLFGADIVNDETKGPVLTPEEAWNIDTKVDDGRPGVGKVRTMKSTSTAAPNCADNDTPETAEYSLSRSEQLCSIIFIPGL